MENLSVLKFGFIPSLICSFAKFVISSAFSLFFNCSPKYKEIISKYLPSIFEDREFVKELSSLVILLFKFML